MAFAQTGEVNIGQSAKNLLLLGGLARGLGFVGALAKGSTTAEAMAVGSLGGEAAGGFKSLMIKEAIALGVPNAISVMQGNGLLAPETNMVLAALGFLSPGGASIASGAKNLTTAARLGAMSLSGGLAFSYWSGVSTAAVGAWHGNTQPGWDVIKSAGSGFLLGAGFSGVFGVAGMGLSKIGQSAFITNFATNFPRLTKVLSSPVTINVGVAGAGAVGLPIIKGTLKTFEGKTVSDQNWLGNIGDEFTLANMATGAFITLAYRGLIGKGWTAKGPLLKGPSADKILQAGQAAEKAGHSAVWGADSLIIKHGLKKIAVGAGIGATAKVLNTGIRDISGENINPWQYGLDVISGAMLGALTTAFLIQPKNLQGTAPGSPGHYWANPEALFKAIEGGAKKWVLVSPSFEAGGALWKSGYAWLENLMLKENSRYAKHKGNIPLFAVEDKDHNLTSLFEDERGGFSLSKLVESGLQGPQSGLWMAPLFGAVQAQGLNSGLALRGVAKSVGFWSKSGFFFLSADDHGWRSGRERRFLVLSRSYLHAGSGHWV